MDSKEFHRPLDLETLLRNKGVYPTRQRLAIAAVVFERHQHLTAEELYDRVKAISGTNVSRATVYNTLALFSAQGLVREIKADPAKTFYDSNTSRHHHFFNIDNGKLIDFDAGVFPLPSLDQLPAGTQFHSVDVVIRISNTPPTPHT